MVSRGRRMDLRFLGILIWSAFAAFLLFLFFGCFGCAALGGLDASADRLAEELKRELSAGIEREVSDELASRLAASEAAVVSDVREELREGFSAISAETGVPLQRFEDGLVASFEVSLQKALKESRDQAVAQSLAGLDQKLAANEIAISGAVQEHVSSLIESSPEAEAIRGVGSLTGYEGLAALLISTLAGAGGWYGGRRRLRADPPVELVASARKKVRELTKSSKTP